MLGFTDDDLKRVKAMIAWPSEEEHPKLHLFQDTVVSLLDRLEAAEKVCSVADGFRYANELEAWRKSKEPSDGT
jgi:hypothetical protein